MSLKLKPKPNTKEGLGGWIRYEWEEGTIRGEPCVVLRITDVVWPAGSKRGDLVWRNKAYDCVMSWGFPALYDDGKNWSLCVWGSRTTRDLRPICFPKSELKRVKKLIDDFNRAHRPE